MIEKKSFWRGETLVSKWVIGVIIPFSIAIGWWIISAWTSTYQGAKDGSEAIKKVNFIELQVDTLSRCVKEQEKKNVLFLKEVSQEYNRQKKADSIEQFQALQYLERLINQLEDK